MSAKTPLQLSGPRRVEILQGSSTGYWKRGQHGYVLSVNTSGGMHFVNRDYGANPSAAVSKPGEAAFLVTKAKHGRGGALWFSADGIRFTGR